MSDTKKTDDMENKTVSKRRGFLKKAGATSLVFTLPTQSVWGTSSTCTISGNLSGNQSNNGGSTQCVVRGYSPYYWKQQLDYQWVHNYKWKDKFSGRPYQKSHYNDKWFKYILRDTSSNNHFNCCLIAAYYNAKEGHYPLSNVSPEQYVDGIYREGANSNTRHLLIQALEDTWS